MKKYLLMVLAVFVFQVGWAQEEVKTDRADHKLAKLEEAVDLSEEQVVKIRAIVDDHMGKIKAVKEADGSKEEIQKLRKSMKEAIHAELTEDQLAELKEQRKNAPKLSKEEQQAKKEKMKAERKALREKAKPQIQEARAAFESKLTQEEKDVIVNARALVASSLAVKGDSSLKSLNKEERMIIKTNRDSVKKMLQPIIENHRSELEAVRAEVKPPKGSAVKEREGQKGQAKPHDHKVKPEERFYQRFLLMKP